MKRMGLMGRVAVTFFISTVLPLFLMFFSVKGISNYDLNALIIVLCGGGLMYWIYQGIVKPVDELKQAAKRIESGDLDFTLESESDDEFGELMQAFEQMRIRLKDTAEERVRMDNENKELISNIAHDLKTPLTTIKGYSEGILDGIAASPEKQLKYIQTIYNKACDMNRLIDELNYYAKIETNKIPYNFRRINVADYFSDCAEEIGFDMEMQGIAFSYSNEVDADVEIIADPEQLRKVVNNIISNAVKYMDKKAGEVKIAVEDAGDFVQIDISDNGCGIAAKDLPLIFGRFYRTDASRNSTKGGSGIGLSIVRKIIEDSGGRVWASSKEGAGTCIHFVLRKYVDYGRVEQTEDAKRA